MVGAIIEALVLAHPFAVTSETFLLATLTSLALVHLFYARLYIYLLCSKKSLALPYVQKIVSRVDAMSEELLSYFYCNTTLLYGHIAKKIDPPERREKSVPIGVRVAEIHLLGNPCKGFACFSNIDFK